MLSERKIEGAFFGIYNILSNDLKKHPSIKELHDQAVQHDAPDEQNALAFHASLASRLKLLLLDMRWYAKKYRLNEEEKNAIHAILIDEHLIEKNKKPFNVNLAQLKEMQTHFPYTYAKQYILNLLYRHETAVDLKAALILALNNNEQEIDLLDEATQLQSLEQILLNNYYELRKSSARNNNSLADLLERFMKQPKPYGLDLLRKYPDLELPQHVKNNETAPQLTNYSIRSKRVAYVDIDNTLVLNSVPAQLNLNLINKLKNEYDEVILFTQRNRFLFHQKVKLQSIDTSVGEALDKNLVLIKNIVSQLKHHDLTVRVSCSPLKDASPHQSPFHYYDNTLQAFEEDLVLQTKNHHYGFLNEELPVEVSNEGNTTDEEKIVQYHQLTAWLEKENPGAEIDVSVFDDSIQNILGIKTALEKSDDEKIDIYPPETLISSDDEDSNSRTLIINEESDNDDFHQPNNQDEHDKTPSSKHKTLPTFYLITNHFKAGKLEEHHCYKLSNQDFKNLESNINYFRDPQAKRQDDYQELIQALEHYIVERKTEAREANSSYNSLWGRITGMDEELKTNAAREIIKAIQSESTPNEYKELINQDFEKEIIDQEKDLLLMEKNIATLKNILNNPDLKDALSDEMRKIKLEKDEINYNLETYHNEKGMKEYVEKYLKAYQAQGEDLKKLDDDLLNLKALVAKKEQLYNQQRSQAQPSISSEENLNPLDAAKEEFRRVEKLYKKRIAIKQLIIDGVNTNKKFELIKTKYEESIQFPDKIRQNLSDELQQERLNKKQRQDTIKLIKAKQARKETLKAELPYQKSLLQQNKNNLQATIKKPTFTPNQIAALSSDRLGKIISAYENQLPESFKEARKAYADQRSLFGTNIGIGKMHIKPHRKY